MRRASSSAMSARSARSAARRTAEHSSAWRRNWASSTPATLIGLTKVPSCGTIWTSWSSRRRASASRTGVRLTPSLSAISFSDTWRPGSSSVVTIASRSASYTARPARPPFVREIGVSALAAMLCILAYKLSVVNVSPSPIAGSPADDQAISRELLERVARGELDGAVRIWAPVPAVALSRLDQLRPGADAARAAASRAGVDAVTRVTGGHAVVVGAGSFCVGFAEPAVTFEGTQERDERLTAALIDAFAAVGVIAVRGELAGEWCPGSWSISSGGVKLAGLAQRAIKGAAWVEAVVDRTPDEATCELLAEVYAALGLALDPATLGSVSEVAGREVSFDELAQPL